MKYFFLSDNNNFYSIKHIQATIMKKNILTIAPILLCSGLSLAQVGINTTAPTKSLDVNGTMKIRTLQDQSEPNIAYVIVADASGNLSRATPKDAVFSSGLYTAGHINWNNILVGSKGTRLDFSGRATTSGGTPDFTFSVFYDIGTGFTVISTTGVTVTPVNATSLNVATSGTTFNLVFTLISGGFANISCTNCSNSTNWMQGTFVSNPNIR